MPFTKPKYKPKVARANKKTILTKIFNISEAILAILIVISFYLNAPVRSEQIIHIPNGSTGSIITYLNEKGLNLNIIDNMIIRMMGYPQSGWINLGATHMTLYDFFHKLTTSKAAMKTITLIPGETYYFFIKDLAKKLELSEEKLHLAYNNLAKRKDGNILAETYSVPFGMNEERLMQYLISYSDKKYQDLSQKLFGEYDETKWYNYITVASIIQKEAANIKEMPIVSSVIYNRLRKNMRLQMDGTLNYGEFSHTRVTPAMIDNDPTSYNTYKRNGLPKDPVCAVSIDAIKAAVFPAVTPYLYFVKTKNNNSHWFSQDYDSHINNMRSSAKNEEKSVDDFPTKKIDLKSIWTQ